MSRAFYPILQGDRESGKSTLIRHLKGEEDEEVFEAPNANGTMSKSVGTGTDDLSPNDKRSSNDLALSYTYVEVKDDEGIKNTFYVEIFNFKDIMLHGKML